MSQTTAFMGGCMFTVMTALLLLIGWLLFGDLPSSNSKDASESNNNNQPYGVLPFSPPQANQPFGTLPFSPIQPNQPYNSFQLPPPPPLTATPTNPNDSPNSDSQLQNQLQQQQSATQQLTTQLERHRMQIEQLTTQTERQRMQIEQLTSQTEQQRIKNEQLLMQINEQQRMMAWTSGPSKPFPVQSVAGSSSNIQAAVLWVLVGIVVALFLGGSIFILSLIFVLTQPQRRSSSVKKYPMQPINFAWPYAFYDEQTDFLPPQVKTRRNR
ncbi:MAG: hypothetical protein KA714_30150 [Limnoraphis sp. WC205]|jgi:hypothetical protein|nr:hypothetical protein [Limnoraphis sp. WC205]